MQFTVHKGVKYAAEIKLSGIETWASDEYIKEALENAGFIKVRVVFIRDDLRIAYGVWDGKDGALATLPEQVVYVEES